ncbi:LysR substrate-binding domain-containing protein [Alicyclobacillus ferrooxydans]|uniref:HTH lysR-type domain-containing protein n=1 Tax=Alicyclobacillus ferrooxydans TaxID=471514 RepID=A0A0P9CX59_9BACL|nr:LysR substrate-binding domain-containing protein [Alicyclobacillus ferrooxydans]KPV44348.1 hypothetical protein AN477_06840 [Alicyclobacillus ferrooxydans]
MELRHLRYFVAVAETLHFGQAAKSLNVSQPPLSKQIADLETEVGVSLFHRTKRHVELTKAGREFYEYAKQILNMAEHALTRAQHAARGETGELVIAFTGATIYDLQAIIRKFSAAYPHVEVVLRRLVTSDQVPALMNRSVSIGHLIPPVQSDELRFLPIRKERIMVALPEHHPLADGVTPIKVASLAHETFILTPRNAGMSYYDAMMSCCRRGGFIPRVELEVDHLESIVGFVSIGMGISLVPESLSQFKVQGVVYQPLEDALPAFETALAWREDNDSPIVHTFIAFAKEVLRPILLG